MDRWEVELDLLYLRAEAKHADSNTAVKLELSNDPVMGWVIIEADFYSTVVGERLINRHIRDFSFSAFEQMLADTEYQGGSYEVCDLPHVRSPQFYEAVARQFLAFKSLGKVNPIACMSAKNDRPMKTVQGWVTGARKRGLIPHGRPGLAG